LQGYEHKSQAYKHNHWFLVHLFMPSNKFEEKMIPCSKPQHLVLIFSCPKKNHLNNALGENSKSCVFCISFMSSNLKNRVQFHKISSPTPWDIQWSCLYLRCDNNVFLRLLYAFDLVFCNRVMCLCLNLSNKYLQKIFKIIFNSKWFLKSWKIFCIILLVRWWIGVVLSKHVQI
jgi:hypothetical protein